MTSIKKQNIQKAIQQALDARREKRHSVTAHIPLIKGMDDETLRRLFSRLTRLGTRFLDHYPLREVFGMTYGFLGPKIFPVIAGIGPKDSFLSNTTGYLAFSTVWGLFPVEILSASDSRIEVKYDQCPLGIEREEKLCTAYMALEPRISEKDWFATRISILECIPDGQGCSTVTLY